MEEKQELPQGWVWTTVEEICEICSGQTPNGVTDVPGNGEFPWFRVGDMNTPGNEKYLVNAAVKLTQSEVEQFSIKLRPAGTIVFPKRGGAIATNKKRILSTASAFDLNTMGLKARLGEEYFWHWFAALDLGTISDGSNVPQINNGDILPLRVPLPPLPEQRRIVAKLEELFSRLDAGVAAVRRTQALLKRYRQSVLHAAVTGELTRAWREAHPAPTESGAALLARIRAERRAQWEAAQVAKRGGQLPLNDAWKKKYEEPAAPDTSELPELPAGWAVARLDAIADLKGGVTKDSKRQHSNSRSVPYLRVANVQRGYLDLAEIKEIEVPEAALKELLLQYGDVLFNEGGDLDKLGRGWIWEGQLPECTHQNHVFRARPYLPEMASRLISYWGNSFGQLYFMRVGKQTTNLASINLSKLSEFPVPLPPLAEQAEIVAEVERRLTVLDALGQTLADELKRAERLRQSLLHRAFTGRLVPQDASDEPANLLLSRVITLRSLEPKVKKPRNAKMTSPDEHIMQSKSVREVLPKTGYLNATEVWKASGMSIEDFYAQLKEELSRNQVVVEEKEYFNQIISLNT